MAAPTPTTKAEQRGAEYRLSWTATWANTDNMTDLVIVDRSGLTGSPAEIEIQKIMVNTTAGIDALFEFQMAAADELIYKTLLGNVTPQVVEPPFGKPGIRVSSIPSAATDGDVMLTTTSAASGDVISLVLWARLIGI